MGQAQLPPQEPTNSSLAKNLGRVGIGLAIAVTATSLGSVWYGRNFLNEQLAPLLQVELTKSLKRPVQLGKVERVGFSSLRFGKSIIPATDKESSFLAVEAIEVKFDLWSYATRRQITLDAIAQQPQLFLKQDVTGLVQFPKITPPERPTKDGFIDLRTVTFEDAQITIQTAARGELVSLSQTQINSDWKLIDSNNQKLKMNGVGRVTLPNLAAIADSPNPEQLKRAIETASAEKNGNKGNLSFVVDWDLSRGQGSFDVQSPDLQVAAIQGFAVNLPVEILQGQLAAQARILINAKEETSTESKIGATKIAITGKLRDGAVKAPQLSQPITKIAGQINFDGSTATLSGSSAEYGLLKTTFDGTFNNQKGFNLNFASAPLDLAQGLESFNVKTPVAIAGEVQLNGNFTGTAQKPALILNITTPKTVSFDRVVLDRFLATIELKDLNILQIKNVQATSAGATITGEGQIRLAQKNAPAEILFNSNIVGVAENFANLYDTKLPIAVGQISSSLQFSGYLDNPQILAQIDAPNAVYPTRGEVFLADGLATIRNAKVSFPIGEVGLAGTYNLVSGAWKSQLNSNGIPLSAFLLNQKGIIEGLINLRSDRGGFTPADITADGTVRLPQGLVEIPDAIAANLIWDGRNLFVPSLQVGNYLTAKGKVDLAFPNNSLSELPTGIAGINLDLLSRNVNISRLASLSSAIPRQASGVLNFNGNLSGALDRLIIAGVLQLDNVDLPSLGTSLARQGIAVPSKGSLDFNGSITGYLTDPKLIGNLQVAGLKINQFELDNLSFNGSLDGTGGIDKLMIAGALQLDNVDVASLGRGLARQGIAVPSRGSLDFKGSIAGYLTDPKLIGNLQVAGLKINQLELDNLSFNGSLDGISKVPQVAGDLLLAGLRVDKLAFDPRLEGKLNFNGNQGLNVDLRGGRDRITARLDRAFRPIDFNLNLGESTAIGKRFDNNPNRLQVAIANIPVPLVAALAGQKDVSGKLSSNLIVDFSNSPTAFGEVTVDRPRFGRVVAERAVAKITYANGILDVKDGSLIIRQGESNNEYKFRLTYNPNIEEQIAGVVQIAQGRMQDVFATLQWANVVDINQVFSLSQTGSLELKPLEAIRLMGEPLYKQLQYLTQIELREEQQETANSARNYNLPPLTEFRGDINGNITFGLNKRRGIRLGFDLVGKKFEYGKFAVDDVKLEGRYFDGVFTIVNANFQSDKSYGRIANARLRLTPDSNPLLRVREQSGEIELRDFPIESLRPLPFFSAIPFDLTGKVNGNLSITGTTLFDTKVVGNLSLANGTVNRQAIELIAVKFVYDKLNINFDANMQVAGKDAVLASGNIGIFGVFNVKLNVKDEGIAFINLFNQPVRWVAGKGNINLTASGTFKDPKIAGKITVDNATVKVAGLPGDFTEVLGDISFTSDRLISNITSNFSDGKLALIGILPISNARLLQEGSPEYQQALVINADKLKLNIRDLSSDNFNTRVIVLGSLLEPRITGEVLLGEGRLVIGNDAAPNRNNQTTANANNEPTNLVFDRLSVKLQNMQVTRFPIFNFLGEGTLIVNGTLLKPEPDGRIKVTRGQFNAISTRFRLDRGYENFVEFRPNQGLNPILNVRVSGAVAELTRVPINSNRPNDLFSPNEIPASNLGAQRTLRVQASVTGTALMPDIRLSSSPPRSQAEILALIGGGILQQQGGSDPAAALASFAGGTILNFLQDAIGEALSIAEFNLSPVTTVTEGNRSGTLGLSAEAAIDVSNSFSIALQRIINDSTQPTNFSVRYRLDPNLLLRGNYGSNGSTGISIEYENRF